MTEHDAQQQSVSSTTTGYPAPAWRKAYRAGDRPGLRAPYREVVLSNGRTVPLYDTSGPYTDADAVIDVTAGLSARTGVVRDRRHGGRRLGGRQAL